MPAPKKPRKSPAKTARKPRPAPPPVPAADVPNPFAPAHWPVKTGQVVYYITSTMAVGGGKLAHGTVRHYNPAVEGGLLHTKGRPVVTIDPIEGDAQSVTIRGIDDVAEYTPEGKAKLEVKIRARLLSHAADLDRRAADARREADLYTPGGVAPTTRPKKAKPKKAKR